MILSFTKTCLLAALGAAVATTGVARASFSVVVPGTANIFGSGQPMGSETPSPGGAAPGGGNPGGTAAPFVAVTGGTSYTLTMTGAVNFGGVPSFGPFGPDGRPRPGTDEYIGLNGLSGIKYDRAQVLLGVFLDDSVPAGAAPPTLDFSGVNASTLTVSPVLRQVFFIGDGRTGIDNGGGPTGTLQQFIAPAGATRLFLGLADSNSQVDPTGDPPDLRFIPGWYNDNSGEFVVTFNGPVTAVPAPAGWLVLAGGLTVGFRLRRRVRN